MLQKPAITKLTPKKNKMYLENVSNKKRLTFTKGVGPIKVHTLLLPEDVFELKEIKSSVLKIQKNSTIAIHFEKGIIVLKRNNYNISVILIYQDRNRVEKRQWVTADTYEIVSFLMDFLKGNYETYLKIH